MATRYWVGGSGTWDTTTTTNWSTTSGGAGGASAPTSADDVIFDANSNVGTTAFTVTMGATANCLSFSTGGAGGALDAVMTVIFNNPSVLNVYGSFTLPASNLTWTATTGGTLNFLATTTGNTIITNGVPLNITSFNFNGVGGGWTLGSAVTAFTYTVTAGAFDTGNYNMSGAYFATAGVLTKTVNWGSSTITCTNAGTSISMVSTGLTFNAGTSTLVATQNGTFATTTGLTFYNVSFTSTTGGAGSSTLITGANTYNNLSFSGRTVVGQTTIYITGTQTVTGTLTVSAPTVLGFSRCGIFSQSYGTPVTLTAAAVSLVDTDFRDITGAGTATWSGTRLGDLGGNIGITFPASKTVYWNLAGTQSLTANGWAATQTGTPATTNFPLAQDIATFTDTNPASGVTIYTGMAYYYGTLDFSTRTIPLTINNNSGITVQKDFTLSSAISWGGTGISFLGRGVTQTVTSAGTTLSSAAAITQSGIGSTLLFADACIITGAYALVNGTLSTNYNFTCSSFSNSGVAAKAFSLGAGQIYVTGTGIVVNLDNAPQTITGTPTINVTSTGSTAITVASGAANKINYNFTGGTYALTIPTGASRWFNNLNFTGFAGSITSTGTATVFGDLTLSTGMDASLLGLTVSGTTDQAITSNGKTISTLAVNKTAGTLTFNDAFTSSGAFTHTSGSFIANYSLTCASLNSSNTATRAITFGGNVVSLTGTGTVWNTATTTGLTFNAGTSTISLTDNSATARSFSGGGLTYWNLQSAGTTGSSALTLIGNNTFNNISSTKTVAHSILFTAGSTTTLSDFVVSGSAGNLVTISSPTAAFHTLVKVGTSNVSCNYLNISYSHAA